MYLRILLNIAPMCTNNTSWRSKDYYLEAVFYPDLFKSSANSPKISKLSVFLSPEHCWAGRRLMVNYKMVANGQTAGGTDTI